MYLYNAIQGYAVLNQQLDQELNKAWEKLGLDYTDLDSIYELARLVKEGNSKLQQFEGGK